MTLSPTTRSGNESLTAGLILEKECALTANKMYESSSPSNASTPTPETKTAPVKSQTSAPTDVDAVEKVESVIDTTTSPFPAHQGACRTRPFICQVFLLSLGFALTQVVGDHSFSCLLKGIGQTLQEHHPKNIVLGFSGIDAPPQDICALPDERLQLREGQFLTDLKARFWYQQQRSSSSALAFWVARLFLK